MYFPCSPHHSDVTCPFVVLFAVLCTQMSVFGTSGSRSPAKGTGKGMKKARKWTRGATMTAPKKAQQFSDNMTVPGDTMWYPPALVIATPLSKLQ